jgi:hypothetical protein
MEKLDPTSIHNVLTNNSSCCCKRQCNLTTLAFQDVLHARKKLFGNAAVATEQAVSTEVAKLLQGLNPQFADDPGSTSDIRYSVLDVHRRTHPVCSRFWAAIHGCCESKMVTVRRMVRAGSKVAVHGNTGKGVVGETTKFIYAHSFWTTFFDECCQKPTDSIRLFPVNKSHQTIYDEYFVPWFGKLVRAKFPQTAEDELPWVPSFTVFQRARKHDDFKDVKKRPKHYHARCADCAELNHIRLRGFVNDFHKERWKLRFDAHEAEARAWHVHEEARKNVSRVALGRKTMVLGYDDTSCLEVPKFTNRDPKNLTTSRLPIIPFNITNYTSGETAYVYTLKGRYPKGGNRLCTVLYHYLRKVKFSDHQCRHARTLILQADNYSENKNNTLFFFCSELVARGWFDEVYLEYGPPGHTHNGTDAVHRIHNRIAGNFNSATLGEFQSFWKHSWRKDFTEPTAVINDAHLDWTSRYENSFARRISGFTTTPQDDQPAKAFKIHWSPLGNGVEMLFKPTVSDPRWLGRDHQPESPGFFMLQQVPHGKPKVIPGNKKVMVKKYINQMTAAPVRRQIAAYQGEADADKSLKWLQTCAVKGYIPYKLVEGENVEDEGNEFGSWGPKAEVGIPGRTGEFFVMKDRAEDTDKSFWSLPRDIQEYVDQGVQNLMLQRQELCGTPNVRYASESPASARNMQTEARTQASESKQAACDSPASVKICPNNSISRKLRRRFYNGELISRSVFQPTLL